MNGVIVINKEKGYTSFDVVACLRRILSMKKIGHTGTLDPDAVGVLPVCVGVATKAVELLTGADKEYIATVQLGSETDTQDASGRVLRTSQVAVTEEDIQNTAKKFLGKISQIPPMYSAIKQDGKKLYELAREGKTVERKPRQVTIDTIEIQEIDLVHHRFTMRVVCSKGTYIRTLCQDMGEALGCYAHMAELCRTKTGQFSLKDAMTLDEVEAAMKEGDLSFLTPVDKVFYDLPALNLNLKQGEQVRHGVRIRAKDFPEGARCRMYDQAGEFLAVSVVEENRWKIEKTFFGG
ncbi:MAG: tRNA pseudouridine(55) synthase TruB [Clostridia bacterium]|nr:tRNA pseudouridine(55) synthase TruB [Clostridia bacterium]